MALPAENITIGTGVTMSGAHDMEGCAFDPASGKVYAWFNDQGLAWDPAGDIDGDTSA